MLNQIQNRNNYYYNNRLYEYCYTEIIEFKPNEIDAIFTTSRLKTLNITVSNTFSTYKKFLLNSNIMNCNEIFSKFSCDH